MSADFLRNVREIPADYEPVKVLSLAGEDSVGVLCKRPDGGISDILVRLKGKACAGVCPACGRDMKEIQTGTLVCSVNHILVVMTNAQATSVTLSPSSKKKVRILNNKRSAVIPPSKKTTIKEKHDADIAEIVRSAMQSRGVNQ
jgi:uncharacterized Zn finger protein (UPF0148 family)